MRRFSKLKLPTFVNRKIAVIVLIAVSFLVVGATTMSSFGPSSAWGIDAELNAVGYKTTSGINWYTPTSTFPDIAQVVTKGARIVTVDYDGSIVSLQGKTNAGTSGTPCYSISGNEPGFMPPVTQAVGQMFYVDETGKPSLAPVYHYDNASEDVICYFGFSIMFTTRVGELMLLGDSAVANFNQFAGWHPTDLVNDIGDYGWRTKELPAIGEITAYTTVGFHVQVLNPANTELSYQGNVETLTIVGESARYTISTEDASVSDNSIAYFNDNYGWRSTYVPGYAVKDGNPTITYNVINSTTDNTATIAMGAKLRIGADAHQGDAAWIGTDAVLKPLGYVQVGAINWFNVEYLCNILVEVHINHVPQADYEATWASGSGDGYVVYKDPAEFDWVQWMKENQIVMLVIIFLVIGLCCVGSSRGKSVVLQTA